MAVTCECCRLGDRAVLVLCGNDAGPRTKDRRRQQGQLFNNAAAVRVVLRQLLKPLLQGIPQEVEFLTRLVETSLGLERGVWNGVIRRRLGELNTQFHFSTHEKKPRLPLSVPFFL